MEELQKLEERIDSQMKPALVQAINGRNKIFEEQKVCSDLRKNIENLEKHSVTSLRTMVNIGSEVYMQADVPDTRRIFIDVGLGFYAEFTWSEAVKFISQKEEKLKRQAEDYSRLIATINANIKLAHEKIARLYQLSAEKPSQKRII